MVPLKPRSGHSHAWPQPLITSKSDAATRAACHAAVPRQLPRVACIRCGLEATVAGGLRFRRARLGICASRPGRHIARTAPPAMVRDAHAGTHTPGRTRGLLRRSVREAPHASPSLQRHEVRKLRHVVEHEGAAVKTECRSKWMQHTHSAASGGQMWKPRDATPHHLRLLGQLLALGGIWTASGAAAHAEPALAACTAPLRWRPWPRVPPLPQRRRKHEGGLRPGPPASARASSRASPAGSPAQQRLLPELPSRLWHRELEVRVVKHKQALHVPHWVHLQGVLDLNLL